MAQSNDVMEVVEVRNTNTLASNFSVLGTPEGIQRYILGTKKNGEPRAVYDIVKDCMGGKGKKKGKKAKTAYDLYAKGKKKKKKKKKHKKNKHWHY